MPAAKTDNLLNLLVTHANDAIAVSNACKSHGKERQALANAVEVLNTITANGQDVSAAANLLQQIAGAYLQDDPNAEQYRKDAHAAIGAVKSYCASVGKDPATVGLNNLRGTRSAQANGETVTRLRGYTFTDTDGNTIGTNAGDVADYFDSGDSSDVRKAVFTVIGDTRPDSFTFDYLGNEVTATHKRVSE